MNLYQRISRRRVVCSVVNFVGIAIISAGLMGCGAVTPSITWSDSPHAGAYLINSILNHVKCELRDGVRTAIAYDLANQAQLGEPTRRIPWLDTWTAKLSMKLVMDDTSSLSPGVSVLQPFAAATESFTLGLGGTLSSQATRTDTVDISFDFQKDFLDFKHEPKNRPAHCIEPGGLLVDSDLKIQDLVDMATFPYFIPGNISSKPPAAVSHEVQFVVVAKGSVTPTWKLVRVTVNPDGFFSANRTQTSDLILTIGPRDKSNPAGPSAAVEEAHYFARQQSAFFTALISTR